jgi:hypothetical protein
MTVPVWPLSKVRDAMLRTGSAKEAARELGISPTTLRTVSSRLHLAAMFQRVQRADQGKSAPWAHPGFKDMAGAKLCGGLIEVLSRAGNAGNGNARWTVRFTACEHTQITEGIKLRADDKSGAAPRCLTCRPRNGGIDD